MKPDKRKSDSCWDRRHVEAVSAVAHQHAQRGQAQHDRTRAVEGQTVMFCFCGSILRGPLLHTLILMDPESN